MGSSEPEAVVVEKKWTKLLSTSKDKVINNWFVRARVGVLLETLADMVPTYTEKDLVVCHRQNASGAWKCELWTNRDFETHELVFAPLTSQLKETHLSFHNNCSIALPRHGPGAPRDNLQLALDGRGRASLASENLVDSSEHTGALFWLVQRVPRQEPANMSLDIVGWSHSVALFPPLPKKPKHETKWDAADLPTLPIMINKQAIKAHTRLTVMQDLQKSKDEVDK